MWVQIRGRELNTGTSSHPWRERIVFKIVTAVEIICSFSELNVKHFYLHFLHDKISVLISMSDSWKMDAALTEIHRK